MGWAKYFEDNLEIMYERQAALQARGHEAKLKIACANVLPVVKLVVEVNTEDHIVHIQEEYKDRYIVCKDCGRKFLFTANTQKHYDKMGWDNPKRCKDCREYQNTRCLMRPSF